MVPASAFPSLPRMYQRAPCNSNCKGRRQQVALQQQKKSISNFQIRLERTQLVSSRTYKKKIYHDHFFQPNGGRCWLAHNEVYPTKVTQNQAQNEMVLQIFGQEFAKKITNATAKSNKRVTKNKRYVTTAS